MLMPIIDTITRAGSPAVSVVTVVGFRYLAHMLEVPLRARRRVLRGSTGTRARMRATQRCSSVKCSRRLPS